MSKAVKKVKQLLELLELHCELCDIWDDHRDMDWETEEEMRNDHVRIQREHCIPVMEKCKKYGFLYADLVTMALPTVSSKERWAVYDGMCKWAEQRYDLPPFDT